MNKIHAQGTNFRLSGQQLQVYHDGRWGTVCDDGFNVETSRSICYILNGYYPTCARFFNGGYGHTTPNNIWLDQLECIYSYYYAHTECSASPWGVNDCSHSEDVYLDCNCDFTYEQTTSDIGPTSTVGRITIEETTVDTATTMAYPVATSASLDLYVRSITVDCNPDAWNIMIYLPDLYKRHTDFDPSDIYFGRPGCQGYRVGNYLRIDQQYSNCDTHHFMTFGRVEYTNTLVYAYRDPNYKFIIREYRFKIDVECDMATRETVSQHFIESHNQVRVRSNNPSISSSGHYHVHMTFYRDRGFQQQMLGNPLTVSIGQDIFVSVNTPLSDFDVKMKVDSCYTLPSPDAGNQFKFHLIKDGCTSDVNTHVLYLSSHETRFVFRDFEYDTNQDNLYLFCTATFCNVTDYSSACDQSCHSVKRRSVQSPSQNFIRRAETSEALHLSTGRSRRETGEIDETKTSGHAQYISVDDHLFIAVIVSAVGISAIAIFVVIRRYKKPRSRPIDTI
ncbi:LOW QUALITY PROTEIN: CUB and zona pellucida-like domain-containing protein 1 [Argopecten irradians]|uniref:LOW QUALITY PROTEIN: CUB and zona pellucida-like domain-containing protein 1 n=1 Tax=Argopecten irradians TaxID=31199 RepID=UPI0037187210